MRNARHTHTQNQYPVQRVLNLKFLAESDEQPTIKLTRKTQGEITVAPDTVTAGSKVDFTITYKATEALAADEAIGGLGWHGMGRADSLPSLSCRETDGVDS